MIDHVGLRVKDFEAHLRFYERALGPLGYALQGHDVQAGWAGFGPPGQAQLWLTRGEPAGSAHVALRAPSREAVRKFHAAAVAAGGSDNGAAGPRPDYGPSYYAAVVLDPAGNNLEAVCLSEKD